MLSPGSAGEILQLCLRIGGRRSVGELVDPHVIHFKVVWQLCLADIAGPLADFLREPEILRDLRDPARGAAPDFFAIDVKDVLLLGPEQAVVVKPLRFVMDRF